VALLCSGLVDAGHEVVLVAGAGSALPGVEVHCPLDEPPSGIGSACHERWHLLGALDAVAGCDVVIDHCGPSGALVLGLDGLPPALHVAHGPLDAEEGEAFARIAARRPSLRLIAISESQRRAAPALPVFGVSHNGLDVSTVPFRSDHDGYLAFLGRMSPEKGAAQAIDVAARAGLPLRIAAKCREPAEIAYFERHVAPRLGSGVRWLGELGRADKYKLLAGARALLFPIDWPEPFGMVMIEAMACGTPVLATRRGAVPEVVVDGVTGAVRDTPDELVDVTALLDGIDRHECRAHVTRRFSRDALTERYLSLIHRVVRPRPARAPGRRARHHRAASPASLAGG
jgi:glycosyltransferase involved in cell wall biosynthesis